MGNQILPIVNERKATSIINLEELIKNHINGIDKLRDEIKKAREQYNDTFNNSPVFREHTEKVKEATKARSSVKMELSKQPSVAVLKQKLDDLRFDFNEQNKTLSDLLVEYKEQTGATQLDLFDGSVGVITLSAKIIKR